MCKALLPLKLLADAEDWQFLGKTKFKFCIFCRRRPPSPFKKRFRATGQKRERERERIVRKISFPDRVAGMSYLCWSKGSVSTDLASESAVRNREVQGDRGRPLET